MSQPLVSIIISTYNRATTLEITLNSLFYLRYPNIEVIVVNGPSTDDTAKILAKFEDSINTFQCTQRNLSISRNIGIANASGEIVAFIDDDAVPEPDWLDQLVPMFDNEDIAAVGGFIRDHTGVNFQAKFVVTNLYGQGEGFETFEQADCIEAPENERYFSLTGTNSAFRRDALLEIGGFDETFEYFLDETDVNRRLVNAGYRSNVAPNAEIHHKYAPSHLRTKANVPKNMLPICRSLAYFAVVHAVPRYGWNAVKTHLVALENSELNWKAGNLAAGDVTIDEFKALSRQIKIGIRDGISRGADYRRPDSSVNLEPHFQPGTSMPFISRLQAEDRLRLLMLSQDEGSTTPGGIGRWTRLVASGLGRKGHEVTVIGRSAGDHSTVDFVDNSYWRHLVVESNIPRHIEDLAFGLPSDIARYSGNAYLEYLRVLPRRSFGVISGPIWDVEPAAFFSSIPSPVCLSLHTTAAIALESKPEWQSNKAFYRNHVRKVIAAEKVALKRARRILGNSQAIVRDIERLYSTTIRDRVEVVPHGVEDIERHLRKSGVAHDRGEVKILFVGRLEVRKGVLALTEAARRLLSELNDVSIDFVGSGAEHSCIEAVQRLQSEFYPRVKHHGFLSDAELQRFYADADIFVAPSRYESFGLILIEAMRYSVPCVSTRTGGIPEVIVEGKTGFLSEVDEVDELYKNLKSLALDRDLRRSMGAAGRTFYEREFTVEVMVDRLEKFYHEARMAKL